MPFKSIMTNKDEGQFLDKGELFQEVKQAAKEAPDGRIKVDPIKFEGIFRKHSKSLIKKYDSFHFSLQLASNMHFLKKNQILPQRGSEAEPASMLEAIHKVLFGLIHLFYYDMEKSDKEMEEFLGTINSDCAGEVWKKIKKNPIKNNEDIAELLQFFRNYITNNAICWSDTISTIYLIFIEFQDKGAKQQIKAMYYQYSVYFIRFFMDERQKQKSISSIKKSVSSFMKEKGIKNYKVVESGEIEETLDKIKREQKKEKNSSDEKTPEYYT